VDAVFRRAGDVPGLAFTYEPDQLRFFLGRFEPTAPYPDLAVREPGTPAPVAAG
jgi:hypothetical protein